MYPILYAYGPITIYTHDFFTALGLVAGLLLYYHELRRRSMLSFPIFVISVMAIFGGGLGARLITAWEHLPYYSNQAGAPLSYLISHSGKSIIGGIAGGYLAIVLSKRAFGYTRSTGDCYAAAIPLAMVIGRIGCFLSELPLGTPTTLPWGVSVPSAAAEHFAVCPGCQGRMHPSMVYEILFHLSALLLILRYRHRIIVQGDLLKLYLLAAALFRFLVEFLRANPDQVWGLSGPQLVLIPFTLLLIYHFARRLRSGAYRMPTPPALHNGGATAREGA
ncbi:MAG: prolipoprotein diacylglyceryl transferase [Chloroflexota bacterium]|nr:prolipoprotein diacylglyceryl transferase [Chloroflexota bacterium]